MVHLYQECTNIQLTKKNLPSTTDPLEKETYTQDQDTGNMQTHNIWITAEEIKVNIYNYQMG